MAHPIQSILQTGVPVAKPAFIAEQQANTPLVVSAIAAIGGLSLANVLIVIDGTTGKIFAFDPAYTGPATADCVKDAGTRYYKWINALSALSPAQIASILQAGSGLPNAGLAIGPNGTFKGTKNGSLQDLYGGDLVAAIDSAIGIGWKDGLASVSGGGIVASLPANRRRTFGGTSRVFLMTDGTVKATGAATSGVNGVIDGSSVNRPHTVSPAGSATFTKLFLGQSAAYLKDSEGYVWSWGQGTYGVLGHGTTTNLTRPTRINFFVTNGLTVTDIILPPMSDDLASYGVLFLCSNGKLYYCGYNAQAEGGLGNTTQQNTPVEWASGAFTGTITGACFSDYPMSVFAWNSAGNGRAAGANSYGQLGKGDTAAVSGNLSVAMPLTGISKIVATERGTLVLHMVSGVPTVSYAGQNSEGAGGQGVTTPANITSWTAVPFTGFTPADIEIGSSALPTCAAISTSKRLRLWGYNALGAQGTGGTTNVLSPTEPSATWQGSVDKVAVVSQAAYSAVVVQAGNKLFAAGFNASNTANLSIGASGNSSTFSEVQGLPASAVIQEWAAVGYANIWGLVVRTTMGTFGGGCNASGEVGVGNVVNQFILQPVDFPALAGPQGPGVTLPISFSEPAGNPGTDVRASFVLNTTGHQSSFISRSFGASIPGGRFSGNHAGGSESAPTQTLSGSVLGQYGGRGYLSSGAFSAYDVGLINVVAAESQTATARGSFLDFLTTPIGTATPVARVSITDAGTLFIRDGAAWDARNPAHYRPLPNMLMSIGVSAASAFMGVAGYGSPQVGIRCGNAGGTLATPAATPSLTNIVSVTGHGHDGAAWIGTPSVRMRGISSEIYSSTARGAELLFEVTANGTTALTERMRISNAGNVGIGTFSPTTTLDVAGPIKCGSYTVGTAPSASAVGAGAEIYVSNESGGAVLAFSDATNWRRVTDRAVIS